MPRFLATLLVEGVLIFAVIWATALTLFPDLRLSPLPWGQFIWLTAVFALSVHTTRRGSFTGVPSLMQELLLLTMISVLVGLGSYLLSFGFDEADRAVPALPLYAAVAVPASVALWRWFALRHELLTYYRDRVLIVGTGEVAKRVARWITESHTQQFAIVGFASEDPSREGEMLAVGARIVTDYKALAEFCPFRIDRVVVALDEKRGRLPIKALIHTRMLGLRIQDATSFFERCSGKISVEWLLPSWLIFSEGFRMGRWQRLLKRISDVLCSLGLLVATLPLMLLTSLAIKLDSSGPVLYRQRRMGLEGREFDVLKFRSMRQDAEKSGPQWAEKDDPRITRVGNLMRKMRIDELPQLFNVLRGEMSFVGPRPERGHFVDQLGERVPYYMLRLTVRPGITGWAQVEYRYGSTDEDALEKLKYDLYYIKNGNFFLDLWILLKTVKVVLLGSGR